MALSGISSTTLGASLRQAVARAQTDLARAQKEALTGQLADPTRALGRGTAQALSLGRDVERLANIADTNGLATTRLSATQSALKQMGQEAQALLSSLTLSVPGKDAAKAVQTTAATALAAVTGLVNTAANGEYVFSGINTDIQPLGAWKPGSAAKTAFDTAFAAHFGFSQTDPQAADIAQGDMTAFLDSVESQFLGAGWDANWSNASDTTIQSRIALNETASTSVSANSDAIRKLVMAATITADLLAGEAGVGARAAITERARALVAEAVSGIANIQAEAGVAEARVKSATERLGVQKNILEDSLQGLVGVDRYEASVRVSDLLNQVETSYALTARIQSLRLSKFLP